MTQEHQELWRRIRRILGQNRIRLSQEEAEAEVAAGSTNPGASVANRPDSPPHA